MSLRKLKYHEQKLLKKVDFFNWETDHDKEVEVIRRYQLKGRLEYRQYSRLVNEVQQFIKKLIKLDPADAVRIKITEMLLQKLYNMGLIPSENSLATVSETLSVSAVCRRRLPVMMVRIKMADNLTQAIKLVEHGHVRVGPTIVTDPALMLTRSMEDYLTWVDNSKVRRTIQKYNDDLDDFVLLGN